MAFRYMIDCNYGTDDGNMGQISNKVLTHDKTFIIMKNYFKNCISCALRISIANGHYNIIS